MNHQKLWLAVAVCAAPLLLIAACLAMVFVITSGCGPRGSGKSGVRVDRSQLPDQVSGFAGEQLVNAAVIINVGDTLDVAARGQVIAVMTAIGESGLRVLDRGDAAGPDSRGLFQQRGNGAWGSYADRMDPATSSANFYRALQDVPNWQQLPPTLAAHRVQRNADPYYYQQFFNQAVTVVDKLSGTPVSNIPGQATAAACPAQGAANAAVGQGADPAAMRTHWRPQSQTVPDPTGTGGTVTRRTADLIAALGQAGKVAQPTSVGCWRAGSAVATSDHPRGRGCDLMYTPANTKASINAGWRMANWLIAHQADLGIHYLIWQGRIWNAELEPGHWRVYHSSAYGCPNKQHITGCHYDHVHVSVY